MKKYLLLVLFLTCFCRLTFSQYNDALQIDSMRLDSVKRILPLLKDSAKVDMMNEIALRTGYGGYGHRDDSVQYYSLEAYKEAERIGYKSGIAMGLFTHSEYDTDMNKADKGAEIKEKNIRRGIQLAEEVNNYEVLGWGYYTLANIPAIKKDFEKHTKYYKKSINYFLAAGDTLLAAEVCNWLFTDDYTSRGEYEQAFEYGKKSVELSQRAAGTNISISWQQFLLPGIMKQL
jgi:tetratricopeptide (TPR) repeat protein